MPLETKQGTERGSRNLFTNQLSKKMILIMFSLLLIALYILDFLLKICDLNKTFSEPGFYADMIINVHKVHKIQALFQAYTVLQKTTEF